MLFPGTSAANNQAHSVVDALAEHNDRFFDLQSQWNESASIGKTLAPSHAPTNNQVLSAISIPSNNLYNRLQQWQSDKSKPLLQSSVHPHEPHAVSTAVLPLVTVPLPAPEHGVNGTSYVTDVVSTSIMLYPDAPSLKFLHINTGPPETTLLAATSNGTIYG